LSFEEAAGYPAPIETAIRIINQVGVKPGQTLLVSGASGGVGSAVIQVAVQRGIDVIGTAGASNQDYVRSLGAVPTTYGDGLVARVRAIAPVDAALDIAGSGVIPQLIELTGHPAKVLSIADFSAPGLGAQVSTETLDMAGALAEAARLFTEGAFHLPVDQAFPLADAARAQAASQAGHAAGRVIITVP
jgi:NADPH:quinone reductase-like Zn-dependent oxidoreductase